MLAPYEGLYGCFSLRAELSSHNLPLFSIKQTYRYGLNSALLLGGSFCFVFFSLFHSATFSSSVRWIKCMFPASSLRRWPCANRMRPQSPNEPAPLMFWHLCAWNIYRRQRGFSLYCLDVCLWAGAQLYVLAQSLVWALHSVTLFALVNSELRLRQKIDSSALYPSYPPWCWAAPAHLWHMAL